MWLGKETQVSTLVVGSLQHASRKDCSRLSRVLERAGVVFLPLLDSTGTVQVVCTDRVREAEHRMDVMHDVVKRFCYAMTECLGHEEGRKTAAARVSSKSRRSGCQASSTRHEHGVLLVVVCRKKEKEREVSSP